MVKLIGSKNYVNHVYAIITIVIIWFGLSASFNLPVIPSPFKVFIHTMGIFYPDIAIHALYSLWRILAGIFFSLLIGVPLGLCMGYFKYVDKILSPIVYFLYPIPKIALLPVVMLLFGLGEWPKIIMIMMIIFFQILVASRDAVKDIPEEAYYSLYSLGAGRIDIFREVIIPASMPGIITSVRVGMGTAVSVLFFTETFGTEYGMGYFIMDSWVRVNYLDMYSGILLLSVIGFSLFSAIDLVDKKANSWKG